MVQVPYTPFSTVSPAAPDTPQIRLQVSPNMFGANVGQAMERLGTSEEQVGGELFQRAMALQQLTNENDARAAQTDYATQASLLHAKFGSQLGTNANPQALADYIQQQKDLRESIRGRLKTTDAQVYYDRDTLPFFQRNVFSAAGHAEDQTKQTALKTSQAQLDVAAQQGWTGAPGELEERIRSIDGPIDNIATIAGMTPDQKAELRLKTINAMSMHQIEYQSFNDPQGALQMLDDNQKLDKNDPRRMGVDAYEKTLEYVRSRNRIVGSEKLAQDIYSPDKSIDKMFQEADSRSGSLAHDDPMFGPAVRIKLRSLVAENKSFETADNAQTRSMLIDKVIANPQITNAQLLADPGMMDRVSKLPPSERAKITGGQWLETARNQATFDKQQQTVKRLTGLTTTGDHNDMDEFLSTDFSQQGLNPANVRQMIALRARVVKQEMDPHIEPALRAMSLYRGPELEAAGVVPGTPQYDKDTYLHYRGAMAIAVDTWRQDHKGQPPTAQEVKDIVGPSVIKDVSEAPAGASQFMKAHWYNSHRAFNPPESEINKWGQDSGVVHEYTIKTGQPPSDDDLRMMYLRQQFMDLYAKGKSSGGSTSSGQ